MQQADQLAAGAFERAHLADVGEVVPGLGVVDLMHADRIGIVVDGHVPWQPIACPIYRCWRRRRRTGR